MSVEAQRFFEHGPPFLRRVLPFWAATLVTETSFEDCQISSRSWRNLFVPYDGVIYVAPEGIKHYIACHQYRPPDVFVEAVVNCPPQKSAEYQQLLLECGGKVLFSDREG